MHDETSRRSDSIKMKTSATPKISSMVDRYLYAPQYESYCSTLEIKPKEDISPPVDWRSLWCAKDMPNFRPDEQGDNYQYEDDWAARPEKLIPSHVSHLWRGFLADRSKLDSQWRCEMTMGNLFNQTMNSTSSLKIQQNQFLQATRHEKMSDALKISELTRYIASPMAGVNSLPTKWRREDGLSIPTVRYASCPLTIPSPLPKISYSIGSHVAFTENSPALGSDVPLDLRLPFR